MLSLRIQRLGFACGVLLLLPLTPRVIAQTDEVRHAMELTRSGQLPVAETAWRELVQSHPKSAPMHGALGIVLAQEGRLDEAAAECRKALALNPAEPDVSMNLG